MKQHINNKNIAFTIIRDTQSDYRPRPTNNTPVFLFGGGMQTLLNPYRGTLRTFGRP
jgi:hypothetical protein